MTIQGPHAFMASSFAEAFHAAGFRPASIVVQESKPGSTFDYQCAGALQAGQRSLEIAHAVAAAMEHVAGIHSVGVTGKGFVNVRASDDLLASFEAVPRLAHGERIVIDFGGPNIAKPLHVGHLRSLTIGESLRRLLVATGHDVLSDIHLGDWGLPMGQVLDALRMERPDLPCFMPGWSGEMDSPVDVDELENLYPAASTACKSDAARLEGARSATAALQAGDPGLTALWMALRRISMEAVLSIVDRMSASFDLLLGESDSASGVASIVSQAIATGVAVVSDGAIVIPVAEPGDGERPMPPLILEKADGASTYGTTDVVTLSSRMTDLRATRVLYVVDRRQSDHFQQLARAAERLGIASRDQVVHVAFGTVNGDDGRPLRTRSGGVPRLDALLDDATASAGARMEDIDGASIAAVGIGALKFLDLSTPRESGYAFDLERALSFEGDTGPYVQYAAVRLASVLGKGRIGSGNAAAIVGEAAHALLLECARMPDAVMAAVADLEPCRIAQQLLRIARAFSRFYADAPILGAVDETHRLALCAVARERIATGLELLGISVPNRM